jgi:hypothetical protein
MTFGSDSADGARVQRVNASHLSTAAHRITELAER